MYTTIDELYDLTHTIADEFLSKFEHPWEALEEIGNFIAIVAKTLTTDDYINKDGNVWIHRSATVAPTASITGPCIIGANTEIRHCAFIRGNAIIGENCVIGNSTEVKNSILFDNVQVPHFNYVGDSIIGYSAHLGAGAITSNVKSDKSLVVIHDGTETLPTGLKKVGAMIGDYVEIGCNSVLNPGCVIGRNTNVYPLSSVRGVVPSDSIWKNAEDVIIKNIDLYTEQ